MEFEAPELRLYFMHNSYSQFLEEAADRIFELADRAPDIAYELRRFAADLIELAAKAEECRDPDLQD
jgi:hypothetical protein